MTRPHDISQAIWDEAEDRFWDDASCAMNASGFADDVVCVIARALSDAYARGLEDAQRAVGEANARVGSIETPLMRGDNLAVTLCTHFDDGEDSDDDTGWSPAAIEGYEEVTQAIKDHYMSSIRELWSK